MTDIVDRIRTLNVGDGRNADVDAEERDEIADDVQKLVGELNDLHNWKSDYRDQIKTLEAENAKLKQQMNDYVMANR
jgi:uncharacterized coiled-coil DUF342 family protein